jgi:hypothetical protein
VIALAGKNRYVVGLDISETAAQVARKVLDHTRPVAVRVATAYPTTNDPVCCFSSFILAMPSRIWSSKV